MTGYRVVNLTMMIEELGEGETKRILSNFPCPLNPDVECLISKKAIEFAKQGWAQTHLVFASYKNEWALVGGNVIIATTKKSCDFSGSFCYST